MDILHVFLNRLNEVFPEPAGSVAAGILFGARQSIPAYLIADFRTTGLTHILALSGFNIVILVAFFGVLFSFLPKRFAIPAVITAIIFFVMMVGPSPSVVRAAIMGSLTLVAQFFGRHIRGIRSLVITATAMVFVDISVITDIGFQLSFAATAGILLLMTRLQERCRNIPSFLGLKDIFLTTVAAQALTFPLIVFYFGGFSIISFVANLFVLPAIPLLMLGSFLSLFLGQIAAAPTWLLFEAIFAIVHFFAGLPFAFIEIGIS